MDDLIKVSHVQGAWSVQPPGCEATLFRSGRAAEASARRLAERLAQCGCTSQIMVQDRGNALIAVLTYSAAAGAPRPTESTGHGALGGNREMACSR